MQALIDLQREYMKEYNLDGLIAMTPENITYSIGTSVPTQTTVRSRPVFHILTMDADPIVVVVNIEDPFVKENSWISNDRIFSYPEFIMEPIDLVVEKLVELRLPGKKVGIEFDYISQKDYFALTKALPDIEFVDASEIFSDMRQVKLKHELDIIEEFGSKAEGVIYTAFENARAGISERELANYLTKGFNEIGGDKLNMLVVASGERSCILNGAATDRILKKGDIVRVDLIGLKNGYYCDVCRTAVVGEPEDRHVNIWNKIVKSHDDVIKQIKPGTDTKDIYNNFRKQFIDFGFDPIDFVGHGLGITLHEEPYINNFKSTIIKENMVLCVEPIYVIDGECGYQLENEVIVTATGNRVISATRSYDRLPIIKE